MGQVAMDRTVGTVSGSGPSTNGQNGAKIRSYAPATGELIGEAPNLSRDDGGAAVERARRAQQAWGALPVEERCDRVLRYRDAIVDRMDEIVDLLVRECGKPKHEALLHEVTVVADLISYFAKHAPSI